MKEIHSLFFELIKSSLNLKMYDCRLKDDFKLYQMAKINGLSGTIFHSIDPTLIEHDVFHLFQMDYFEYQARDVRQLKAIQEVDEIFNLSNIEHIFLKGSFLKGIYPDTYMRSMGDIDILVRKDKMNEVHQVLNSSGYFNWANSTNHDCFVKDKDIFLEIHPQLDTDFDDKYDGLFLDIWSNAKCTSKHRFEFKSEFMLAYLMYHNAKHLSSSGIGLRNILDIGLFCMKFQDTMNAEILEKLLRDNHLFKLFQNFIWFNNAYFGFVIFSLFLTNFEQDSVFLEKITDFILTSGVHGKGEDHNPFVCGISKSSLKVDSIQKGRKTFILKTLFPSKHLMQGTYHYLKKYPWLLPFSWIQRGCKLLFKKTKSSIKKIKNLRVHKDTLMNTKELYDQLGL
ncbi:MAG: nucleotidyltransferase family protein [Firmicutes bacterium]|nr:nucleotidyltransferase family protein [Bacillota bacterium]